MTIFFEHELRRPCVRKFGIKYKFVYLKSNIVEVENGVTSFLLLPYITKEQNRVFSDTFAKRQIYQSRSSSWAVVIYFVVLPAQIQKDTEWLLFNT